MYVHRETMQPMSTIDLQTKSDIPLDFSGCGRIRDVTHRMHYCGRQMAVSDIHLPPMRYIKLGPGGAWAARAFEADEVPYDHREVPHALAANAEEAGIVAHLLKLGKEKGSATATARRVMAFYTLGADAIWVTFARGRMWWVRAAPEVVQLEESDSYAVRFRKTIGRWNCQNLKGETLYISGISSRLTKVTSTQSSLCRLPDEDYAWRKICGDLEPALEQAQEAREGVLESILTLIANLHWADFETLIDLILARSGWNRVSGLGGTIKDADLEVEQVISGERALVQVKSSSGQKELDDYVEIFKSNDRWPRLIFACHSPRGALASGAPGVSIWTKKRPGGTGIPPGAVRLAGCEGRLVSFTSVFF